MRIVSLILFVVLFGCLPGEKEDARNTRVLTKGLTSTSCLPSGMSTGMNSVENITHDGVTYNYYVYLPAGYDECSGDEYSLVLNFHGGGQNAIGFKDIPFMTEFKVEADLADVVLVWVDSNEGLWNNKLGRSILVSNDHVGMVPVLLNQLTTDLSLDSEKIHILGFSEGAIFAQYLSFEVPDTFASVVAVSGITGEFYAKDLTGSPDPLDAYLPFNWSSASVPSPYTVLSIWPDHLSPTLSSTPALIIRGALDGVFSINGGGAILLPPLHHSHTLALEASVRPQLADIAAWSKSASCTSLVTITLAGGTRVKCVGGSQDLFIDTLDSMQHSMPAMATIGFDGPGRVMNFILAHQ